MRLRDQAWLLTKLASAAADDNHQSRYGLDPPRRMTADEKAIRLAIVRRAVAAVEALPDPSEHRSSLATSLGQLGRLRRGRASRPTDRPEENSRVPGRSMRSGPCGESAWLRRRQEISKLPARPYVRRARVEPPPKADAEELRARLANGFVAATDFDQAREIAETLELQRSSRDPVQARQAEAARGRPQVGQFPGPPRSEGCR